jgi:pseudouridine kinase
VKTVIIPMGEKGVWYATSETSGQIPSILTKVVDPTGAGDALTSVVLYGLLNELSIDDAVRLGVSAASLTLRRFGSVVPDLDLETIYENLVI